MVPSDDDAMENPDPPGKVQKMSSSQAKNRDTFHLYLHLPFELRAQIRAFAIEAAIRSRGGLSGYYREHSDCSNLASISKEWQCDVERVLFSKISIDPLDEKDFSGFAKKFTERRKKYLTQLEIAMDDDFQTGFWEKSTGLLDISRCLENTGQLLQQLGGLDSSDDNTRRSIAVIFKSSIWTCYNGRYEGKYDDLQLNALSLWEPIVLSKFTSGGIPTNVALWAIKSEFPSPLNMVTHLTFVPDCVPLAAAKRMIQTMPNLESCNFGTSFHSSVGEAWRDFTDLIHELRVSAPSLCKLKIQIPSCVVQGGPIPASVVEFGAALRELSQSLESLDTPDWPVEIHEAFFLPFSENSHADADSAASGSPCTWPNLQHLILCGFWDPPSPGPGQATFSAIDVLVAAGKASLVMPSLKSMEIAMPENQYLELDRENFELALEYFSKDEERTILEAYAPLTGAVAELVEMGRANVRVFKWNT